MNKSISEMINTMVKRINENGCRVTIPYNDPSPLQILFDGEFSSAGYIPSYPPVFHLCGMPGHISVSNLTDVTQVGCDKYVVKYGDDSLFCDMMVQIAD